jgi:hypothetical protein
MPRFFHWRGRDGHRREEFWRRRHWRGRDEPGPPDEPGSPPPGPGPGHSFSPLDLLNPLAPLKLFGLGEVGEGDGEYAPADEETESYGGRRHRFRRALNQTGDVNAQGEVAFSPGSDEREPGRQSGRWVRHHGRLVLLGV